MQPGYAAYLITAAASFITSESYTVMIWCNYKIYKFLKIQRESTLYIPNVCEIQAQITKTLIAQAIIPLLIIIIPLAVLFLSMYGLLKITPQSSAIPVLIYSYLPMMNALSILVFVKPYRIQIIMFIKKGFYRLRINKISGNYAASEITRGT